MARQDSAASGAGVLLIVGIATLYFAWSSIVRWTADQESGEVALWMYANDPAPGSALEGRVRVDTGLRVSIAKVVVEGAGEAQTTEGAARTYDTITEQPKLLSASDELEFAFQIPDDATPGETLHLTIRVISMAAERDSMTTFTNDVREARFEVDAPVYSSTTSALRRAGKAALAVMSWLAVVLLLVRIAAWYARRQVTPSAGWVLLLAPYGLLGFVWFRALLGDATRLHGWIFVVVCLAGWFAAVAVAARRTRRLGNRRYVVVQAQLPVTGDAAYRSAEVVVPVKSAFDLEVVWAGSGMPVERRGKEIVISSKAGPEAIVPMPASELFGGGEPFEIQCSDRDLAIDLITMATAALGDLTWSEAGKGGVFTIRRAT